MTLLSAEGTGGVKASRGRFSVGNGLAREHLAIACHDARPVRRFPDVEHYAIAALLVATWKILQLPD